MNDQAAPRIQALWPTLFLSHRLPGHDRANPVLLDLIQRMQTTRPDLTTDYLEGNFFAERHPVIEWLEACVRRCVSDYAGATGRD